MRRRGLLVVVSGPAGSGKTTLAENAVAKREDIVRAITATTRSPRGSEVDGQDYYFLSRGKFEEGISSGKFAEYAEFNGNLYGTPKCELEKHLSEGKVVLLVIEVQGAAQLRDSIPNAVHVFVLPPTRDELRRRLVGRGTEKSEDVEKRLSIAEEEVRQLSCYNYLVINDDMGKAGLDLLDIIDLARMHHVRGGELESWLEGDYSGWHK